MMTTLQVATPQGESGRILSSAGDYLFRYHHDRLTSPRTCWHWIWLAANRCLPRGRACWISPRPVMLRGRKR